MSFQFQCPQGHLLEGDPSQAGQHCHCPTCGMLFIIPAPLPQVATPLPQAGPSLPQAASPSESFQLGPAVPEWSPTVPAVGPQFSPSAQQPSVPLPAYAPHPPSIDSGGQPAEAVGPVVTAEPEVEPEPELLHIACPNGHELETPRDMLGQDVLCPYCNVQFRLREKDSVEFKRKRKDDLERKERRLGNAWFNWAIVAAVLVVLLLVVLIFSSSR